jgi:hypothetical protein
MPDKIGSFSFKTKAGTTTTVVQGMGEVVDRLDKMQEATQDIRPAWDELAPLFAARQNAVFDTYNRGKWLPMAPSTLKEHVSPLVQTGIMREGLTLRKPIWVEKTAAGFGAEMVDRRVFNPAVLNTVGHRRGSKQVPPRVVVPPLNAAEKRRWIAIIERHILKPLRAA